MSDNEPVAVESYFASEGAEIMPDFGPGDGTPTPYMIEVRFLGGLSNGQKDAFKAAANRWSKVIVGDLPAVEFDGEVIDDLLILAAGKTIDGPGRILGQAGPTHVRPDSRLPLRGAMEFDSADLTAMESDGTLADVITHEMGHVIGIGTIWKLKNLISGTGTDDPRFTGGGAQIEWGTLNESQPESVPIANTGGPGTREGHWRERTFGDELMSGFVQDANNPLSRLTVASLKDLGYTVDLTKAESYELPGDFGVQFSIMEIPHAKLIEPEILGS